MTAEQLDIVDVTRVVNGERVPTAFVVGYEAGRLTVLTNWSERLSDFRVRREYAVREVRCDFEGRGYQVRKVGDGETYSVYLADDPLWDTCDCRGHYSHGHCVHRDALRYLAGEGRLRSE